MSDPIVKEVRRARDAHAARFNYDLDAIYQDIKEQERKSGRKCVAGVSRQAAPNQAPEPNRAADPAFQASRSLSPARRPC